jgi:uncharacterized membrane protein YhfC
MRFDPIIALSISLAAIVCLLGPFVLGILWRQRTAAAPRAFGWGMAVFAVALILRLWQFPLGRWIHSAHPSWTMWFVMVSACTAGVFEEVGRWVGYRTVLRNERSQRVAVMFGLGHGACESILLVSLPMVGLLIAWVFAAQGRIAAGPATQAIQQQLEALGAWGVQLAVIERASAIVLHVGLSLIVLQAFTRGDRAWLLLAIGLHAVVDASAVVLNRYLPALHTELIIAVAAVTVLYAGLRLSGPVAIRAAPAPASS